MASTPGSPSASPPTSPPGLLSRPKMICSALLFIFYCIPSICCVYKYLQWSKGRINETLVHPQRNFG
ncbi:hypothetical protein FQA47_022122 [Oryzias melastigma]|uniref:Uncharacterized protein n=1 Tax=Oryzias melastigma TaxID=30732 RepID=A0A834C0Z0_ORYME|nr:hypothetical protein FQA47_022122 [Oryzias melastigma]